MTIVTNETELQNALSGSETEIQIANDIEITTGKQIARSISIRSTPGNNFTLLKSADNDEAIFNIDNSALLTLTNITIDGNKEIIIPV